MSTRARRLLRAMPYCMSLTQRMRVFEHVVKADKQRHQPENAPGVPVRVRRCVGERGGGRGRERKEKEYTPGTVLCPHTHTLSHAR